MNLFKNPDFETGALLPEWVTAAGSPSIVVEDGSYMLKIPSGFQIIKNATATKKYMGHL